MFFCLQQGTPSLPCKTRRFGCQSFGWLAILRQEDEEDQKQAVLGLLQSQVEGEDAAFKKMFVSFLFLSNFEIHHEII